MAAIPLVSLAAWSLHTRGFTLETRRRGSCAPIRASSGAIRTPHSGYHFNPSFPRRFFEGWYFKITLPEKLSGFQDQGGRATKETEAEEGEGGQPRESFAWMYAVEDPIDPPFGDQTLFPGVAAQIMGPQNSLLLRKTPNTARFWGSPASLSLGAAFSTTCGPPPLSLLPASEFDERVSEGFQVSPRLHQGHLSLRDIPDTTLIHDQLGAVSEVSWRYTTRAVYGWGGEDPWARSASGLRESLDAPLGPLLESRQLSTAGWLAALPVFEPHWQVCMAAGLSTGWVRWGDKVFSFVDAPSYAEKNWGASFPIKWFWVQCNSFEGFGASGDGRDMLAVTAVGAIRRLPLVGALEDVGMVAVHWRGFFWEFVPWRGQVEWQVDPWGSWRMTATAGDFEVVLEAQADDPGTVLHAPSETGGFQPSCRDSFYARLRLCICRKTRTRGQPQGKEVVVEAFSEEAAVEVGGGPWWSRWEAVSQMGPLQSAVIGTPLDVAAVLPYALQPPGL